MSQIYLVIVAIVVIVLLPSLPDSWELTKRRANDKTYRAQHKFWAVQEYAQFFGGHIIVGLMLYVGYKIVTGFFS